MLAALSLPQCCVTSLLISIAIYLPPGLEDAHYRKVIICYFGCTYCSKADS